MKQVQLHEKMGKRKKSHETVKKVEKSPSSEGETFKFSQISIGEEFKRWATVRESMCLSDEQLMKAILDLLEDRRVCPHGCYMKNTPAAPEKRVIRPKLVRTVGTQIKTRRRSLGTQSEPMPEDQDLPGESYAEVHGQDCTIDNQSSAESKLLTGSEVDLSVPMTEDVRWKTLKTSHNFSSDEQMLRALLDWYTNSQSENQATKDIPSQPATEQLQTDSSKRKVYTIKRFNVGKIISIAASSSEREYKASPAAILEESSIPHGNVQQSNDGNTQNTGQFVSEANNVVVKGEKVVGVPARSGEATVGVLSEIREATAVNMAAGTVETTVLDSVTAASAEMQTGQNVYIPVVQEDYRGRDNENVYKQMNIQQTQVELQRSGSDGIYKPINNQLGQQRLQVPYVLPNTVPPLESLGIFPTTTASVLESSGPFICSTQVDYEPYRRKIDENDTVQSQKYKKIRLTPTTRSVSYPAGSGQETLPITPSGEQYGQLQSASGYSYLQSGYRQAPGQGH